MRAAGGGKIVTRAMAATGFPPLFGRTSAVAFRVPVEPPVTRPVESTLPSKNPPEVNQLTE